MLSIPLGPIALPLAPVLLVAAAWLAGLLARTLARRLALRRGETLEASASHAEHAGRLLTQALAVGLLAARLAHVGLNASAYAALPWAVLDLRDGGWMLPAGIAAGLVWIAVRARSDAALRMPLGAAASVGIGVYLLARALLLPTADSSLPALQELRLAAIDAGGGLGATVSLREAAAGRSAVVNLWASWCGPCRAEMPTFAQAQERHPEVAFIFVNQGEPAATVARYRQTLQPPLAQVLLDPERRLGAALGSRGLPTTIFIDADGRMVEAHFGPLNAAALEAAVRRLGQH